MENLSSFLYLRHLTKDMKPAVMKRSTISLPLNANLEKGKDNKLELNQLSGHVSPDI